MAIIKKDYVIPLRKGFVQCAPHNKTPKAMRVLKAYVVRHCKVDVKDVKIGAALNALMWENGIRNPPPRVAVTIVTGDGLAKVELQGLNYVEAPKIQAKKEPETLKTKLQEKLKVKADEKEEVEEEAVKAEAKTEKPVEKAKTEKKSEVKSE